MASTVRNGQTWHAMMASPAHDEMARQMFVQSLFKTVEDDLVPGTRKLWAAAVEPRFKKQQGRAARDAGEVRKVLMQEPYVQTWSSIRRTLKEMQYDAVGPMVERQLPALIDRARTYRDSNRKLGTLTLQQPFDVPRYMAEVDIHAKPGSFHTDLTDDDVFAGAEFDRTFYIIYNGALGPLGEDMGASVAAWTKANYPNLRPKRILDIGCTVGHGTLGWVDAFPDAEVHAIDTGAPCLRYAHARAEALGRKVHFSLQNGERTNFPDGSFDIVTSHILLHELPRRVIKAVFAESHRLLRKGSLMLHQDGSNYHALPPIDGFFSDWYTHYNNEPFQSGAHSLDKIGTATAAGFDTAKTFEAWAPSQRPGSKARYYMAGAVR